MKTYDDKIIDLLKAKNYCVIAAITEDSDITFKASYVVVSDVNVSGKISAAFDLIVIGNVSAKELEVKGKFICLGDCNIKKSIIVQGEIIASSLIAETITCRDKVTATKIDVDSIMADGNILVENTLAVAKEAVSTLKIICGETAFGSGKITARSILTGESIDLDDGVDAIVNPWSYPNMPIIDKHENDMQIKWQSTNNFRAYIKNIIEQSTTDSIGVDFERWMTVLVQTERIFKDKDVGFRDLELLLILTEIANSKFFSGWTIIKEWHSYVLNGFEHFCVGRSLGEGSTTEYEVLKEGQRVEHLTQGRGTVASFKGSTAVVDIDFDNGQKKQYKLDIAKKHIKIIINEAGSPQDIIDSIYIGIENYGDWIKSLNILRCYGKSYSKKLYNLAMDLIFSKFGLKAKFVSDRLKDNGWSENV